jgi:cytochrome c-type biogenesis protein CcmH/NrfG
VLLDRKRINRWARWVALGLAVVFGLSFVFMGVGTGINVDWGELWSFMGGDSGNTATASSGPEDRIKAYEATLAANPDDVVALKAIATEYVALNMPVKAAEYLEKAAVAAPEDEDIYVRLGVIYLSPDSRDYVAAARVLNVATSLDPNDPQLFLSLGSAERGAGNIAAAILAWNRYLQLAPDAEMADTVRAELEAISPTTTTESAASSTTTTTGQ